MKIPMKKQTLAFFECSCGWKFQVDDNLLRKDGKYKCPKCGKLPEPVRREEYLYK